MNPTSLWYSELLKPTWAPPAWLFGPVWSVLYILIAVSFGYVFLKAYQGYIPLWVALPFALNLIFNLAFSPIQFGLQSNFLASITILLILGTLAWAMYSVHAYAPWVTYINIPYFLWVSFATVLQLTITVLNW